MYNPYLLLRHSLLCLYKYILGVKNCDAVLQYIYSSQPKTKSWTELDSSMIAEHATSLHFLGNEDVLFLPSADLKGLGCLNEMANFILFTIILVNKEAFRQEFSK